AVATQATGTAHEPGSPLSTMAVLLNEMRAQAADKPDKIRDIDLLRSPVAVCKSHSPHLVDSAGRRRMASPAIRGARAWRPGMLQRWLVLRPDASHHLEVKNQRGTPWLEVDTTLDQAITNLLNNAADAAPDEILISLDWNESE